MISSTKEKLRFAHIADLHLGGWREKTLKELNFQAFQFSINKIIEENLDFVIFAGDIFDNPLPSINLVELVVLELKKLKERNIPIYVIGGSHDYSNLGNSFISLLDKTNILIDVGKFELIDNKLIKLNYVKNEKLRLNIVGVLGKKHGLDKNIYNNIPKNTNELNNDYCNIFVFHTTINNFKPDFMKNVETKVTMDYLPKGFDYYAGGHIHTYMKSKYSSGIISYSGCLFPNNFSELKREVPGFNICEFDFNSRNIKIERIEIKVYEKEYLNLQINKLTTNKAFDYIMENISKLELNNKIFLLELDGVVDGRVSEIGLNKIVDYIYSKGAIQVLKNTYKLLSVEMQLKKDDVKKSIEEIEDFILNENLKSSENKNEEINLIKELFNFNLTKLDGEKTSDYEKRIIEIFDKKFGLD